MTKKQPGTFTTLNQGRAFVGAFLLAVFSQVGLTPLFATDLPTGAQVVAGSASIGVNGANMNVVNANGTIINWQDFSVGAANAVNFQQAASSSVLNRVVGSNLSQIYGTITSPGKVFLINPNGVMIGSTGIINTAGFTASTLNIRDQDFTSGGALRFAGHSAAKVQNLGAITATDGNVFLIAQQVENAGTITAAKGTVGLYASNKVYLTTGAADAGAVRFAGTGGIVAGTGVSNSGTIQAARAELKATGNLYALAINNTGTIRATGTSVQNGVVRFVASGGLIQHTGTIVAKNADGSGGTVQLQAGAGGTVIDSGTIDASSQTAGKKGGTVELTGDQVAVDSSLLVLVSQDVNGHFAANLGSQGALNGTLAPALIDVSGPAGGGTILVGGDAHGANPEVYDATVTYVGPNALLKADATDNGDGGKVVAWANGSTQFYGKISARGGSNGGNGGWVETSGKQYLDAQGNVNTLAVKGKTGTWLLDPGDLQILNGGSGNDSFGSGPATTFSMTSAIPGYTGNTSTLYNSTLESSLNGTSVEVDATNITWTGSFSMLSGNHNTLTLNATGDVGSSTQGDITLSGAAISIQDASLVLNGASDASGTHIGGMAGKVALTNGTSIATTSGNVTLNGTGGASDTAGVNIVGGSTISTGSGNIVINGAGGTSAGGAINIGDAHSINGLSTTGGNVTLTGNGSSGAPDIALRGAASINLENGGAVTLNANGTHQIAIQETTLDGTTYNTPQIMVGSGAVVSLVADTIKYSSFNATSNAVVGTSLASGSDVFFGDTSSTIKIAPYTQSRAIFLGDNDPGTSALWANGYAGDFGTLIVGQANGTGKVTIGTGDNNIDQNVAIFGGDIEFDAPVYLQAGYTAYLQANGSEGHSGSGTITQGSGVGTAIHVGSVTSLGLWVGDTGTINLTLESPQNIAVQGGSGGVTLHFTDGSGSYTRGSVNLGVFATQSPYQVAYDSTSGLNIGGDGEGSMYDVAVANGGNLTLIADHGLEIDNALSVTGGGNVNIDAGAGAFILHYDYSTYGDTGSISADTGNVTIAGTGHIQIIDYDSEGPLITGNGGNLTFKTSSSATDQSFTLTTTSTVNDGSTPTGTYMIDSDSGVETDQEGSGMTAVSDLTSIEGFQSVSFAAGATGDLTVVGDHSTISSDPLTIGLTGRNIFVEGDFDLTTAPGSLLLVVATNDLHLDGTVSAYGVDCHNNASAIVASVGGHLTGTGSVITTDPDNEVPNGAYALYLAHNDSGNDLTAFSGAAIGSGTLAGATSVARPTVNTIYYPAASTLNTILQTVFKDPGKTVQSVTSDTQTHTDQNKPASDPNDNGNGAGTSNDKGKKPTLVATTTTTTDTGGGKTETVVGAGAAGAIGGGGFTANIPIPPALGNALTPAVRNQLSVALQ